MIYPIVAYGDPVLKKTAQPIEKGTDLKKLVADMYETMYNANGVGLAAPQIGMSIRLFVVDGSPMDEDDETLKTFKKVFVNPTVMEETGDAWAFEEGCLSIPGIRADVNRPPKVTVRYFDEDWNEHTDTYDGLAARIIQHEYDHLEGVLFVDKISAMKKRLIQSKLTDISRGKARADYRLRFAK
ncbi:MAG: peptide deformylase [Cytophagales bacterium]|jgi:peptide deformylase|nr:peptide deformylase [Cytophagales bacterium]